MLSELEASIILVFQAFLLFTLSGRTPIAL
jgi:hypothetical protein